MNPLNPALIINGPAVIKTRRKVFYSKGNVTVTPKRETFSIDTASFGQVDERESNLTHEIKFTPVGRLDALAVLWALGARMPGDLIHNVKTLGSINLTSNVISLTAHGFPDLCAVRLASTGTLPAGLAPATTYFLHAIDANSFSLHDTEAHAAADTNLIDITDAGTGVHKIIEQEYVIVSSVKDNAQYEFFNTAITGVPDINCSPVQTAIGEVTIECFRQFGTAPTDAAAFYTKTGSALSDSSFDPAALITDVYDLQWGATAPWSTMPTKAGIKIAFPLTLEAVGDDSFGVSSRRITALGAQLNARPLNVTEDDIYAKLVVQGAGAGRGRSLTGADNLNVIGQAGLLYVRLYAVALQPSSVNYDSKEERSSDMQWKAMRSFTAGVPNALYYVGVAAPS